jgi:hypothetical protein
MDISWAFEPDLGIRFHAGSRTILLKVFSSGLELTQVERESFAKTTAIFIAGIANKTFPPDPFGGELSVADIPLVSGEAFKIVSKEAWEFVRKGHFKVGSPAYYAGLPTDDPAHDWWEGYSCFSASNGGRSLSGNVAAAFDAMAFCATRASDGDDLLKLRARFAGSSGRIIKILDVNGFAAALGDALGAQVVQTRDVHYRDIKLLQFSSDDMPIMKALAARKWETSATDEQLEMLGRSLFSECYEAVTLASAFCKPVSYSAEQERRILFQFGEDVPPPFFKIFHAPDALKYLDFGD